MDKVPGRMGKNREGEASRTGKPAHGPAAAERYNGRVLTLTSANRHETPGFGNGMHAHRFWEVVLYTRGTGKILLKDGERAFKPGRICLFPPNLEHADRSTSGYESLWIWFTGFSSARRSPLVVDDPSHHPCRLLAELLYHEHRLAPGSVLCRETLQLLLGYLLRHGSQDPDDSRVEAIKHLLIANVANPDFRLHEGLAGLGSSAAVLHELFKKHTGISPLQYLIDLRLRDSRVLLRTPGLTLAALAPKVGFRDPYHFSRVFKQKVGLSPSEFRAGKKKRRAKRSRP